MTTPLSDYEAQVVQEIAAWKAGDAGLFNKLTNKLTMPVAWTLQHVIPESAARSAIETAYATSDWLASPKDLLERAQVDSIHELPRTDLKLCDDLAVHVARGSQAAAAIDGAVTGAGGALLAAADVGALGVLAMRAIQRTGHCYGQPLDQPHERFYVMGILLVATTKSSSERLEYLGQLQDLERWFLAETVEAIAIERLTIQLLEIASLETVPGISAHHRDRRQSAFHQPRSGGRTPCLPGAAGSGQRQSRPD
ncbi:MAG: EcsC family protein [Planctomycetaceae bacterium]